MDFFISYAGPDRAWAEWVAWQLRQAGYAVELDAWDWSASDNAILRMNDALAEADRLLALYSTAYFQRDRFTTDEWTAAMARRPDENGRRRLVPIRIENVTPPPLLAPIIYKDLFALTEQQARTRLLTAVGGPRGPRRPRSPVTEPTRRVRGCPGRCRRCGTCHPATRRSPAARSCSPRCGSD